MMSKELKLELEPGILNVQRLRIVLERHGSGDKCQEVVERVCHHHLLAGSEGADLDLFKVVEGRLIRTGTFAGVLSVEEVEES